ncbi:Mor transcription activator family protein [Eubacterium aggregans]|uniref:Mor transcription activator family protein n=1 Tax=Eubacterium aggregans TaxID=81409 RepID=UPI003F2F9619
MPGQTMLDRLTLADLDKEQRMLADSIGLESYKLLIQRYGGSYLYIRKEESLVRDLRDRQIRAEYDGRNLKTLARHYQLSEVQVRNILY